MSTRNPIRYLNGKGWQVLHDLPHAWVDCQSHEDALLIAEAEQLCNDVFGGRVCSEAAATRLDEWLRQSSETSATAFWCGTYSMPRNESGARQLEAPPSS